MTVSLSLRIYSDTSVNVIINMKETYNGNFLVSSEENERKILLNHNLIFY